MSRFPSHSIARPKRLAMLTSLAFTLAGCASFTPDGGMAPVKGRVAAELGKDTVKITSPAEAAQAKARVAVLLAKPLTADSAVQIALLNNRGLQAEYNTLGISEAAYVAAYCRRTGREGIPHLDFYIAFNLFRLAGILHGIRGRMIRGNAASAHAAEMVRRLEPLAELAWAQAKRAGAR